MSRVQVVDFPALAGFAPVAGVVGRALFGDHAQLTLVEFAPDTPVGIHTHPQEQLSIVLRGMEVLLLEDGEVELTALQGYAVPGGHPHGARSGPDGALVLEVFHPLRPDYLDAVSGAAMTWSP